MTAARLDRLTLDPVNTSPAAARRWVAAHLTGAHEDLVETAVLLAGELVTNVVLHAQTPMEVRVERRADDLHIRVADGDPSLPTKRRFGDDAETGRGLRLVEALASAWGVEALPDGKVVWFDLPFAAPPAGTSAPVIDLDQWPDLDGPVGEGLIEVRLLGVPLAILQRASEQHAALEREFMLIAGDGGADVPSRLLQLRDQLSGRFGAFTDAGADRLRAAMDRGDESIDISFRLPGDIGPAVLEYDVLLDEADAFCRAGALLTLAATEDAVAVRKWLLLEFVSQAAGRPPGPWGESAWALSLASRPSPRLHDEDGNVVAEAAGGEVL